VVHHKKKLTHPKSMAIILVRTIRGTMQLTGGDKDWRKWRWDDEIFKTLSKTRADQNVLA
jgi:hypothetical protein